MLRRSRTVFTLSLLAAFSLLTSGCQTLSGLANLRNIDFSLDDVSNIRLAGIDVMQVQSYQDLNVLDVTRLGAAVARKQLPLQLTVHVGAENPQENSVNANLVGLEWTLLLDEKETVSGILNDRIALVPGQRQDIPITMELDLMRFFNENALDLFNLARNLLGQQGPSSRIKLIATPSVQTPLGPIQYPRPITILNREVGQ